MFVVLGWHPCENVKLNDVTFLMGQPNTKVF